MNRKFLLWAMALVVAIPVMIGGGYWLYWSQIKRYEPVIINDPVAQIEIQKLLDQSGAVSPGGEGPKLWMVSYRDCGPCQAYQAEEFPALQAAGIDTRVIMFVRPDDKGLPQSTAEERTTVAELWLNRSWALYQSWLGTPVAQWKPVDFISADTDLARQGVVLATQAFVQRLSQHLSKDRATVDYPLILYRDKANQLKVCACTHPRSFGFVRHDLGVDNGSLLPASQPREFNLPALPSWLGGKPAEAEEGPVLPPSQDSAPSESSTASETQDVEDARPITDAGDW